MTLRAVVIGVVLLAAVPARADSYAYMTAKNDDFGVVDLNTGVFTKCGNSGVLLAGLGIGPHRELFAAGYDSSVVYTVNPANGALTTLGTAAATFVLFGSTVNQLFGVDAQGNLYGIDADTGTSSLIGHSGVSLGNLTGLSAGAPQLYLTSIDTLYGLDIKTGRAHKIGVGTAEFGAMARTDKVLYGGRDSGKYAILTINPKTGADSFVAYLSGESADFWGLAPTPAGSSGACAG